MFLLILKNIKALLVPSFGIIPLPGGLVFGLVLDSQKFFVPISHYSSVCGFHTQTAKVMGTEIGSLAPPVGFEPTTYGLEGRCYYPAEL